MNLSSNVTFPNSDEYSLQDTATIIVSRSEKKQVRCNTLKIRDEFDAPYGRTARRCQLIKRRDEDDRIHLTIKPVIGGKFAKLCFTPHAAIEIYTTPYAVEQAIPYEPQILSVLEIGEPGWTFQGICLAVREKYGKANPRHLRLACERLVERRELISRYRGKYPVYRKPLPHTPNFPVIAYPGTPSERPGWIVDWKPMRDGRIYPLVHWLSAAPTFMSEEQLEPATAPLTLRRIEAAQAIAAGNEPDGFIELPSHLLQSLIRPNTIPPQSKINADALLEIGKQLGMVDERETQYIRNPLMRQQIFDWLDTYYPGWNYRFSSRRAS